MAFSDGGGGVLALTSGTVGPIANRLFSLDALGVNNLNSTHFLLGRNKDVNSLCSLQSVGHSTGKRVFISRGKAITARTVASPSGCVGLKDMLPGNGLT